MTPTDPVDVRRFELLEALDLLHGRADPAFDRVVRVAARAVRMPIALLTMLGPVCQWVPARVGWATDNTTLLEAFCRYATDPQALLEVPDATLDERFRSNPLVTGPQGVRFYAGHPVVFEGVVLGTVCVLDTKPRRLSDVDRAILKDLAAMVSSVISVRHGHFQLVAQEQRLRESEQRLRLLWETTTDVVLLVDERNCIRSANPAALGVFGYSPEELFDKDLGVLQPARLRHHHRAAFERYIASGVRRLNWACVETTALHRDGHEFAVEVSFSDIRTSSERLFAASMRDVSARKQAQDAAERLEGQLQLAQKLEAIGVFAGGIAHDFNNVLAGIMGNVSTVVSDLGADHVAAARLHQVLKGAKRGRDLVHQILAFARRQPKKVATFDLGSLITDVTSLLQSTLPAGVGLEVKVPTQPLYVAADASQIDQVLMNLTTNACHSFHGQAGRVEIGAELAPSINLAAPQLAASSGCVAPTCVHLWVKDTGSGIAPDTLSRIFEPFYTTKAEGHGTGLGLSVAHGIVAAHGGALTVDSALGRGSTFHVYLPTGEAVDEASIPTGETTVKRGSGEHVLYVDDDEVMALMVEQLLVQLGYRSTVLTSGREALALLEAGSVVPDIVITDQSMPDISGQALARELAGRRPGLPVVLISGNLPADLDKDIDAGLFRAVLHKQFIVEELGTLLHDVLGKRAEATG